MCLLFVSFRCCRRTCTYSFWLYEGSLWDDLYHVVVVVLVLHFIIGSKIAERKSLSVPYSYHMIVSWHILTDEKKISDRWGTARRLLHLLPLSTLLNATVAAGWWYRSDDECSFLHFIRRCGRFACCLFDIFSNAFSSRGSFLWWLFGVTPPANHMHLLIWGQKFRACIWGWKGRWNEGAQKIAYS